MSHGVLAGFAACMDQASKLKRNIP
jgi:hypothetical protein